MSKLSSISSLLLGVLQDVPLNKIRITSHTFHNRLGEVDDLASSIKQIGLLQPIVVRLCVDYFEIVSGNRRYLACKSLGLRKIACHVVELNEKEAFEISIIENLQRKNLSPIEEAKAFKAYVLDFGWGGVSELAQKIGRSTSYVTKRIQLLDLPENIVDSIINCRINTSIAEEISCIKDKSKQSRLGQLVSERRLSMRNVRQLLRQMADKSVHHDPLEQYESDIDQTDRMTQRAFDKSIIALKIALNSMGAIIEDVENNWIIYEILMQHKNMLHTQIDLLIKQRRKI